MRSLAAVILIGTAVILIGTAACSSARDDVEHKAAAAKVAAAAARAEAEAKVRLAEEKVRLAAEQVRAAERKVEAALPDLGQARALGAKAKAELDKVYQSTSAYDLDVTRTAATAAHAEKLAAMPHVTVGDLTVGYEEASGLSVTGTRSSRHFRATWRRGDRDVIVGYQTASNLDLAAFAALLHKLVPIVERVI